MTNSLQLRVILFRHYDGDRSLIVTEDLETEGGALFSGYFGAVIVDEIVAASVDLLEIVGEWSQ